MVFPVPKKPAASWEALVFGTRFSLCESLEFSSSSSLDDDDPKKTSSSFASSSSSSSSSSESSSVSFSARRRRRRRRGYCCCCCCCCLIVVLLFFLPGTMKTMSMMMMMIVARRRHSPAQKSRFQFFHLLQSRLVRQFVLPPEKLQGIIIIFRRNRLCLLHALFFFCAILVSKKRERV